MRRTMYTLILAVFCLQTPIAAHASESEHKQLEAHEHGHGELRIVQDEQEMLIELRLPGVDAVGFEHAPETEDQQEAVKIAVGKLRDGASLFSFSDKAECRVEEAIANSPYTDDGSEHGHEASHEEHSAEHAHKEAHDDHDTEHGDEHDDGDAEHGGHSEFVAEYHVHCDAPQNLSGLQHNLFVVFPSLKEIVYQTVGPNGQHGGELEPGDIDIPL